MKILYLTNNDNALELYNWLKIQGEEVLLCSEKITLEFLKSFAPEIIISYNYKSIIKKDVIEYMNGNIINLHISLLPWNKGAHPNFWSFIEKTPKGVTIHYIDEGLDTGDIIIQKELFFNENEETFKTTYDKLNYAITELFKENWNKIKEKQFSRKPQRKDIGTFHKSMELFILKEKFNFSWDEKICNVIKGLRF